MLSTMAKSDAEKYQSFCDVLGNVLKEGPGEDFANREKIAELLRFASTHEDDAIQNVSLKDYVERMQEGQDAFYYVVADNHVTAKNSPHIEVFRKKGIEVLLLSDRIDDWLMGHLNEFDGKALKDIAKGELTSVTVLRKRRLSSKQRRLKTRVYSIDSKALWTVRSVRSGPRSV